MTYRTADDVLLSRYRTGKPEASVLRVPVDLQNGVFTNSSHYLPQFVASLKAASSDPYVQVKALHDWVALHIRYDVAAFFSGRSSSADANQTLTTRMAVCAGYSTLMSRLLDLAGFKNRIVSGYGRGWGSGVLDSQQVSANHAWTAVQIRDAWHLLDSTWDSGYIDESGHFVPRYSDTYLFLEPALFLYTHLPDKPADQLLAKPLSVEQFKALPALKGEFWTRGLRPLSPLQRTVPADSEALIRLHVPLGIQVDGRLLDARGLQQPGRTIVNYRKDGTDLRISFPSAGQWQLTLFAGAQGESQLSAVGMLGFSVTSGSGPRYPSFYQAWHTQRCELLSPLVAPVAGTAARFILRVPGAHKVLLLQGSGRQPIYLTPDPTERTLFSGVYAPKGSDPIAIFATLPGDPNRSTGLLQY